ncbi:LysR family transcriptional regulator [Pectobacterium betavasculorum]|uniref:LysR family transcriptional regulator n=1 Tax=Pectobacterium betavasculorum TaxID=55207 RepID=UPI00313EEB66
MDFRHLRCFIILAEELHFSRAAARLHIEQSPLSRTIKELEDELDVLLFSRDRRGTQLTHAGEVFLQDARRLFEVLHQARENVRAVSQGYRGSLRIAVSDGAIDPRLSTFLAKCRQEEPEIGIRINEVPLGEQLRGLRSGDFDFGIAHTDLGNADIVAEPLWRDTLVAVMATRHPLLSHKTIPLDALSSFPLIMCDPQACEGYSRELTHLLRLMKEEPTVIDYVTSMEMMLTFVAAGYGIGFTPVTRITNCGHPDIVIRPLTIDSAWVTTYLLRLDGRKSEPLLDRFATRLQKIAEID